MAAKVELSRPLVARTGLLGSRISVRQRATVRETIERLAREHGGHVRQALLDGDRLRSEVRAVRRTPEGEEVLSVDSPVRPGDTLRFEVRD